MFTTNFFTAEKEAPLRAQLAFLLEFTTLDFRSNFLNLATQVERVYALVLIKDLSYIFPLKVLHVFILEQHKHLFFSKLS